MGQDVIQSSFAAGELSPSLFGRTDLKQFTAAAATMRNFFVNYRGGASSRAGTAWIGRCLQDGSAKPPRDIKFQFNINQSYALEFGDHYMRVKTQGAYVLEAPIQITGISQEFPAVVSAINSYANGDWVYLSGIAGMTELNAQAFIIDNASSTEFTLVDIFGDPVNSLDFAAYSSGGSAARIYTLTTPYIAADLPLLKFTQSADVMTLTHNSYPPYNLTRNSPIDWTLEQIDFKSSIDPPPSISATPNATTASSPTQYQYTVTAVDKVTGEESNRSQIATITNSVDISSVPGSNEVDWGAVDGAGSYNIYKAPAAYNGTVPVGSIFGYIGSALGLSYVDANILADFSVTPPLHYNPFSPGQIISFKITAPGTGYTSSPAVIINTLTGADVLTLPIIVGGALAAIVVRDPGHDYGPNDTVSITGGGGSGAKATVTIGPQTGTYPGVVAYFQQRRVFANTINNPDTYFMTQPGAFNNMDAGQIPIASDSIIGTPWAQQVNGIQALVPMPGGLVVFTGLGAWQLSGGSLIAAITPDNQVAQPQAYNGCSPIVPPITISYDILYVQAKGSTVRDLSYDFYKNIYTGVDLSQLSNHLFQGYDILQWAWCEEPYRVIWCVRSDGIMLSFTFSKEQEVFGWARHDTKGLVVSACSISEPPIDALYLIIRRRLNGQWIYCSERMNDRLWTNDVESTWCADCGLALGQPEPNAELQASTSVMLKGIGSVTLVEGGSGYVDPACVIEDPKGVGAVVTATVLAGIITGFVVVAPGSGYTSPQLKIRDSAGTGASGLPQITSPVTFVATEAVFDASNVGSVIRGGGGIAEITGFVSSTEVEANFVRGIALVVPDDDDLTPVPLPAGLWSMTAPQSFLEGALHLKNQPVAVVADGNVIEDITVDENGAITLPVAASQIVIGLKFQPQLQSMYADIQVQGTIQGKRKNVPSVTVRVQDSRGLKMGANQADASIQLSNRTVPWTKMIQFKDRGNDVYAGTPIPLYTGDQPINIPGDFKKPGQIAVQQDYPLPANILAFIPELNIGDDDG